eukprot:g14523.t1
MARKLDARAASFSPSFGMPPPQEDRIQLGASASTTSSATGASNTANASSQGRLTQGQGKSPLSGDETNSMNTPAARGGDGHSQGGRNGGDRGTSNRPSSTARPLQAGGERGGGWGNGSGGGGGRGGGGVRRRRRGESSDDETSTDAGSNSNNNNPGRRKNADVVGRRSTSGGGGGRGGNGGSRSVTESPTPSSSGGTTMTGKGRVKGGGAKGGNANHLLNFQFQPISSAAHQGEGGGGRARRGGGGGGGSGRSKGGGWGIWGGGSARGPMSKEQFLQANFHFLLHNPAGAKGDASSTSPILQEAFFDPDVLVDWDTVDTVRLFRKVKVSTGKEDVSSTGQKTPIPAEAKSDTASSTSAPKASASGARSAAPSGKCKITPTEASAPEFDGLSVMPAAGEILWGSGKKRRDSGSSGLKEVQTLKPPVAESQPPRAATVAVSTSKSGVGTNATGASRGSGGLQGDNKEEAAGDEDEEWRCSICLGIPIVPRVTKCGHGPFCLVCILRHLNGEASARCPLCFDKMYRAQLRRVACQNVRPYTQGGKASLLLLQRERSSLVPTIRALASRKGPGGGVIAAIDRGSKGDQVPGGGVKGAGNSVEESWAVGLCPEEGDESERFSRLVRANPSTLRDLAAAEQFALLSFRHESMQSGETEWIPYVSEAQALVNAQLERFSSLSPSSPATATGALSGRSLSGFSAIAAEAGGVRAGSASIAGKVTGSTTSPPKPAAREGGDVEGVGVGAAESTSTSTAAAGAAGGGVPSEAGLFRFFQSCDGQKAFLHPLNMRQLLDDSEMGLPLPERVDAKVLEVETVKLTPELRRRLPFLSHLPIHCDVSFLEVDMAGLVSEETTRKFREEIQKRERKRRSRAAQETRAAKKEARLEQDRTDRIAAMRDFTVDLQGPTPGGSESPRQPTTASVLERRSFEGNGSGVEAGAPGAASAESGSGVDARSVGAPSNGAGLRMGDSAGAAGGAARGDGQEGTGWSFARVTAMNGHFPTLKPSAESGGGEVSSSGNRRQTGGAWGASAADGGGGGREAGVWGAKANGPPRAAAVDAVGDSRPLAEGEGGVAQSGKKKGRKEETQVPEFL